MWQKAKLVLGNRELMFRILFTLLMLLLFRILVVVKIPLFDRYAIENWVSGSDYFAILNSFGGQALQNGSIVALGISPYITGSIVVQLLQMVIPQLKEWREQGEAGKTKTSRLTRYIAIGMALAQSVLLVIGTGGSGTNIIVNVKPELFPLAYVIMILCVTAGTALTIWISDLITKKGIGNGTSILITAGIVTSIPTMITTLWNTFITNGGGDGWKVFFFILILVIYVGMLVFVTFMQLAQRKIPVQYANRQGKSDSNIPLKLNSAGVMPVIFASTLMSIPLTIIGFTNSDNSNVGFWFDQIFNNNQPIGFVLYVVLIVVFSFFYSFMTIEPNKIADNLSKSNAYIPGVRPGEDTKNYVARLLFKITVIGTVYLVLIAIIPIILSLVFELPASISIGGTSLLIVVGVAIETMQQIETEANKTEYSGIF
ncbi:preprotein translocase subunit SecY [Acholeplasma sp. OttesenSCG-928-E16]|nr:preprotein translocase subunit SecY [Acholeplasma sp. OttesenSCG-928-E16]